MSFSFKFFTEERVIKEIINDNLARIIKESNHLFCIFLYHYFNNSIHSSTFPVDLKNVDLLPIHKKKDKIDIENYHPISIRHSLSLSQIYERSNEQLL